MGIQRNEIALNWNYFLALEEDLERLARYVDLSGNEDTYSMEIARLFLSCSSEVDVLMKQLCKAYDGEADASSINAYFPIINANTRDFIDFKVTIPRYGVTLTPWSNWKNQEPPLWWQAHNKVKHRRHEYFERANLKNCLNSIAALYVTLLFLGKSKNVDDEELPIPRLLNVDDSHFYCAYMGRYGAHNVYEFE